MLICISCNLLLPSVLLESHEIYQWGINQITVELGRRVNRDYVAEYAYISVSQERGLIDISVLGKVQSHLLASSQGSCTLGSSYQTNMLIFLRKA